MLRLPRPRSKQTCSPLSIRSIRQHPPRVRAYTSQTSPPPQSIPIKKRGLLRTLVLPTTLFAGLFYGAGTYGSFKNDKFRDFFMDQVPLGESLLNLCEDSNLEHLADLSKGAVQVLHRSVSTIKSLVGTPTSSTEQQPKKSHLNQGVNSNTQSNLQPFKPAFQAEQEPTKHIQVGANPDSPPVVLTVVPTNEHQSLVTKLTPTSSSSDLPTYDRQIPLGHEPPPGYRGLVPRPRNPSVDPLPPPPPLPLLAPTVKELSISEPILGQLASSIDSLAGFLRDHPNIVVRAKDPSGQDAPRVLSTASEDLKSLASRLETIKSEKQAQLQSRLEQQAKEYGKILLDAEKELHQRLDQQESNWKETFDQERTELMKSYESKLIKELETQQALINERLEQELISQGLQFQRRWMREIKAQVELEREGRWGKLAELESCMKELGRVTVSNEEYLEDHLRINQLWNAIRAISVAAFERPSRVPLDHEARVLKRMTDCANKLKSTGVAENDKQDSLSMDPDVISVALDSIPATAIESGIESLPSLTLWFKNSVHPRIQSASLLPNHGGLISYLSSHVLSCLFFTNVSEPIDSSSFIGTQQQDPISILNQVNSLLDLKDLDAATRVLNSLSGWPKVLARDWLEEARKHLEFQQAIQVIEAEATLQSLLL